MKFEPSGKPLTVNRFILMASMEWMLFICKQVFLYDLCTVGDILPEQLTGQVGGPQSGTEQIFFYL